VTDAKFTVFDYAATYSVAGPVSIPEPVTGALTVIGLGLMTASYRGRKIFKARS